MRSPGRDHLGRYLRVAPVSLALERAIECAMLASVALTPPLLDIGCGDGLFASVFYEQPVAVGLDIDLSALRRARRHYRSVVDADAARMPFVNGAFATVLANSVLEHVRGLDRIFAEVHRILRPRGTFVLTVPTPAYQRGFFYSRLFRAIGARPLARAYETAVNVAFRHREVHEAAGWSERLAAAGFSVVDTRPYLSAAVIALDDLLYPSAALARLAAGATGHYFFNPALRRFTAPLLAAVLKPLARSGPPAGGYVLLVARRA